VRVIAFTSTGERGAKEDRVDVISDWGDQHDSVGYGCVEQEKMTATVAAEIRLAYCDSHQPLICLMKFM
jgi:hypothetical protein